MKELFEMGVSFQEFVNKDKDTHKEKTLEIYHQIELNGELVNQIRMIDRSIYVLVFGEIWCPDCMINIPILQKMADVNDKIMVRIVSREGNEPYMEKYGVSGKHKIPIFVFMDESFQELGIFTEQPQLVKDVIAKGKEAEIIVAKRKYRKAEYANETIREILEKIKKHS